MHRKPWSVLLLAAALLPGPTAYALNVNYQVRAETVWHYEGGCDDEPSQAQEYTAIIRAGDNTFAGGISNSTCLTVDFDGNTSNDYALVFRSMTNSTATNITVGMLAFEDDAGSRCTFDSGDDCLLDTNSLGNFPFRSAPTNVWTSYGPFGSGSHYAQVGVRWSYTTVPSGFTEFFNNGAFEPGVETNDLDFKKIIFTPDGSAEGYTACIQPALRFTTDPAGGTTLSLADDNFVGVTSTMGKVVFYGVTYSNLFVGSNGYITFGGGTNRFEENTNDHFKVREVAALFDDLNPLLGGTISWKELGNRLVVTYQNVPEFGTFNSNSMQVELYFDGRISITLLGIAAQDGLVGLSAGLGMPSPFVETDLSELDSCPRFHVINTIPENASVNVAKSQAVLVDFDEGLSTGTVDSTTYKVWGKQTGLYTGTYVLGRPIFGDFYVSGAFRPGEEILVMLDYGIMSTNGWVLNPYQFQFTATAAGCTNFAYYDTGQALGSHDTRSVALGDVDGDGDLDIVAGNGSNFPNRIYVNSGSGFFHDSGQALGNDKTLSVALGDVDMDGDLDFVAGNDGAANRVYLNNGSGVFTDSSQALTNVHTTSIALGDVDGDGDLDIVTGELLSPSRLYPNDGSGVFTNDGQQLWTQSTYSVALGDVDSDGDLDLVAGNYLSTTNRLYLNDGLGAFVDDGQNLGADNTLSVVLGDVDNDHDLDMVAGNYGGTNRVYFNDGVGSFTDSGQTLGSNFTDSVGLGDVDGDGDLDIVDGNTASGSGAPIRVYFNNGAGTFTNSGQAIGHEETGSVALGDLDGDGDLDVVAGNSSSHTNRVYLNISCLDTGDNDADGIPTPAELAIGLNPANPADAAADDDTDGQTVLQEYIAGTQWTNGASFFKVERIFRAASPAGPAIEINAVSGRVYTVESRVNLAATPDWTPGLIFTSSVAGPRPVYDPSDPAWQNYRVKVNLKP